MDITGTDGQRRALAVAYILMERLNSLEISISHDRMEQALGNLDLMTVFEDGHGWVLRKVPQPICQVVNPGVRGLTCSEVESGGFQCEVTGPHTQHRVGDHTTVHAWLGTGYTCAEIEKQRAQA